MWGREREMHREKQTCKERYAEGEREDEEGNYSKPFKNISPFNLPEHHSGLCSGHSSFPVCLMVSLKLRKIYLSKAGGNRPSRDLNNAYLKSKSVLFPNIKENAFGQFQCCH